jgi:hypothetical protein
MVRLDPILNLRFEFVGLFHDLVRIRTRGDMGAIVVDFVPLATANLEKRCELIHGFPDSESESAERSYMMSARFRVQPVSGTGKRHFGEKNCRAVGNRESCIVGDARRRRILELNQNAAAKFVEFGLAGRVRFYPPVRLQFFQAHGECQ